MSALFFTWRPRRWRAAKAALAAVVAVVALGAGYLAVAPWLEVGGVNAPAATATRAPVHLDQGVARGELTRYHHESQGTRIVPLAWFRALEQPVLTPLPVGRFADRAYLARFGFLYEEKPDDPDDLPIGFAVEPGFLAPYARPAVPEPTEMVGLTCAACHTGRLDLKAEDGSLRPVLIEGGSALIDLGLFQDATGRALLFTLKVPPRFDRFARRVLGGDLSDGDPRKEALRDRLAGYVRTGLATRAYAREHKLDPVEGGFARTDALGLIGNRVFGVLGEQNQVVTDAPVNFPHLWDTAWFDWVQYNASIRTPLARNIGEALGVGAVVNLDAARGPLYRSTVNVPNLIWIEELLGGPDLYGGLRPPSWADMVRRAFPPGTPVPAALALHERRAAEGKALYRALCAACHMPPRDELKPDDPEWFTAPDPGSGRRFFRLRVIDLRVIGTDPNQALNFYRRVAASPVMSPGRAADPNWSETISAEDGLFRVTSFVRREAFARPQLGLLAPAALADPSARAAYDADPDRKARRLRADRFRTVAPALDVGDTAAILTGAGKRAVIVANLGYKARPLDGVWATPPYLHNGSVPNLYQLLSPVARRAPRFALGSRRFDPSHVGYATESFPGAFELETAVAGNHNTGHEYRNLTLGELESALGLTPPPRRSVEDRWARALGLSRPALDALSAPRRREAERRASAAALARRPLPGVLGPELSDEERWRLIEYLKTL